MAKKKLTVTQRTVTQNSRTTQMVLDRALGDYLDEINSLTYLKKKKMEDLDDKFMVLKSELKSLFSTTKPNPSESSSENKTKLSQKPNGGDLKKPKDICASSKPSKFTKWLSNSIDKMNMKSPESKIDNNPDCEVVLSTVEHQLKSKYNMTLLPNYKVERLLYKSFQLKNLGTYMISSSDESEEEQQLKLKRARKQLKRCKRVAGSSFSSSFPRTNHKRKRARRDRDVEVINLDNGKKKITQATCFIDLDVDSYDWNEPFFTNRSSSCSDLEIIEDSQNASLTGDKPNDVIVETKKSDKNACVQKSNSSKNVTSPDKKKTWECPICFETSQGQTIVATQCGHIFCKACLDKHISTRQNICPTCRFNLSNKPPITLFNF